MYSVRTSKPFCDTNANKCVECKTSANCGGLKPVCGDGFKQPGEACDNGVNNSNTGACTLSCKLPICGDTFVQAGEQCEQRPLHPGGRTLH